MTSDESRFSLAGLTWGMCSNSLYYWGKADKRGKRLGRSITIGVGSAASLGRVLI